MKIVLDGYPLTVQGAGIRTYTEELVKAMAQVGRGHEYYFAATGIPIPKTRITETDARVGYEMRLGAIHRQIPYHAKFIPQFLRRAFLPSRIAKIGADVFFGTMFFGMFHKAFKTVLAIHDLGHIRFPQYCNPGMIHLLSRLLPQDARRAHAVFALTEAMKGEISDHLHLSPDKIHVVNAGVDVRYQPITDQSILHHVRQIYHLPSRFLLFVGTIEPRKNVNAIITSFEQLCNEPSFDLGLVLAGGKGWQDAAIHNAIGNSRFRSRIHLPGRIAPDHLPALYTLADVFIFPSVYEGFGIPVIEAMSCGTPVVTSDNGALAEVAGDAAQLACATSPEALAEAVLTILSDSTLSATLKQRGFERARHYSWARAAASAVAAFETLQ